jgi:hypothetical protein
MRFLTVFLATTAVTAIAYFALALALAPAPIAAEYWIREMIVIKRDIAKHYAGQQKIIIASGSSTLFSIDAQQLGNELHIPVINYGLHAGLSLQTILGEAEAAAEPGDTILLPLEDTYYCTSMQPSSWQIRNSIAWDQTQWASWTVSERIQAIRQFNATLLPELVQARLRQAFKPQSIHDRLAAFDDTGILAKFAAGTKPTTFAYSAYNLDKLGDMQLNDGAHFQKLGGRIDMPTRICPRSMQLLESFVARLRQKQISTYFAHSPYLADDRLKIGRAHV